MFYSACHSKTKLFIFLHLSLPDKEFAPPPHTHTYFSCTSQNDTFHISWGDLCPSPLIPPFWTFSKSPSPPCSCSPHSEGWWLWSSCLTICITEPSSCGSHSSLTSWGQVGLPSGWELPRQGCVPQEFLSSSCSPSTYWALFIEGLEDEGDPGT